MTAVGNLFLRKSALEDESALPLLKRRQYLMGTFVLVGPLTCVNSVAVALAPLSLIAPCAALTTVWSVWLASCGFLGIVEPFSRDDVGCTLLVVLGIAMVTRSRPEGSVEMDASELSTAIGSAGFISAWLATLVFASCVAIASKFCAACGLLVPRVRLAFGTVSCPCSRSLVQARVQLHVSPELNVPSCVNWLAPSHPEHLCSLQLY